MADSDFSQSRTADELPVVQHLRDLKQLIQQHAIDADELTASFDSPRYRLMEKIDGGGQSNIFVARDTSLDRHVVVKIYRADKEADREVIIREGRNLSTVKSPFVCTCYDLGWTGDRPFLVLEYIEGRQLSGLPFGPAGHRWERLTQILIDVCRGVEQIHAAGLVHLDLKPANIMIDAQFRPKIVDLGLSLFRSDTDFETLLCQGSPSYLAPEVTRGDFRGSEDLIDVFGIGAILYEALTGQPPFERATKMESLEASYCARFVPVAELNPKAPQSLASICERCLAAEPVDRFASVIDVRAQLESSLLPETATRTWSTSLVVFSVAVLVLAVVIAGFANRPGNIQKGDSPGSAAYAQPISANYDSSRITPEELIAAMMSESTGQLKRRSDFELEVQFIQHDQVVSALSLDSNTGFEIRIQALQSCFVCLHRIELDPDGHVRLHKAEYPTDAWCAELAEGGQLSILSSQLESGNSPTSGPACYYLLAGENEWASAGECPDGHYLLDTNYRGAKTRQKVFECFIPFAISFSD